MNLIDVFILAGVFQGIFVGLSLIFTRFLRTRSNQFLGLAILTLTIITFFGWLDSEVEILDMLQSVMWEFLFPVFLFYYFVCTLNHRFSSQSWMRWLFMPFILSVVEQIISDLSFRFDLYQLPYTEDSAFIEIYAHIEYNLSFFMGLGMMFWSGKLLWTSKLKNNQRIKWIKGLFLSILGLYAIWLLADIAESTFDLNIWQILWAGLSILFLSVVYFGIFQLRLIEQAEEIAAMLNRKKESATVPVTVKAKVISNVDQRSVQLKACMEEEQMYRNPELSRSDVADRMDMSSGYFSQFMKDTYGKSFVDFVNGYRVEAARQMLSDQEFDKFSIHAIGLEAGFKSRSAFYDTFQKFTGQTPGEYKKTTNLS